MFSLSEKTLHESRSLAKMGISTAGSQRSAVLFAAHRATKLFRVRKSVRLAVMACQIFREIFAKHSQTETILHRLAKRCGNGFDLHER